MFSSDYEVDGDEDIYDDDDDSFPPSVKINTLNSNSIGPRATMKISVS
jgi:hypothetical protein